MTGNFHRNSDKDRLYVTRKEGGRGLKSFEESYTSRMVSLRRHIENDKINNHYLQNVEHNEKDRILRIGEEFERLHLGEKAKDIDQGKKAGKYVKDNIKKQSKESWLKKKQHGYLVKQATSSQDIDTQLTNEWLKDGKFSSHNEGFLLAIQEQEIDTRGLRKSRERDIAIKATMPSICRLCGKQEENIFHIIASCSYFSSNHYLHARHNPVAKEVYHEFTTQTSGEEQNQKKSREMPSAILKVNGAEVWWDRQVTTLTKIPHNKPDIIIWDGTNNECKIIDICVPLDTNLELRDTTKRNNYVELVDQLQRIYPKYKYCIIPIIIGALGTVPKNLKENLKKVGIPEDKIDNTIRNMQKLALLGTLKIVKNFQKM